MGTRNLTCVVLDGAIRVAQYCQWDGCPDGQGATVHAFVETLADYQVLAAFRQRISTLGVATEDEVRALWARSGADGSGLVSPEVEAIFKQRHLEFHRNLGADILRMIADGEVLKVQLSTEFAADSLFCEWAYVVNLDDAALEVFKGFQKQPHSNGRFAGMFSAKEYRGDSQYYPVAEIVRFSFAELPPLDAFVRICTAENPLLALAEQAE